MFIQLLLATNDGVAARNSYVLITCTLTGRPQGTGLCNLLSWVLYLCWSANYPRSMRSVCAMPFQPFPPATTENSIPGVNPPATKLSTLSVQN